MKEKMKDKKFILITDKGLVGNGKLDTNEVLAKLLYAYLSVWNDEMYEIDINEAGAKIVDLMESVRKGDRDLDDLLEYLLSDDDGDDDGEA